MLKRSTGLFRHSSSRHSSPLHRALSSLSSSSSSPSSSTKEYDVVIVGGGLVGACFAASLATNHFTKHLRTLVLDKQAPPNVQLTKHPHPDLRVSALTIRTRDIFQAIGVWEGMENIRMGRYTKMEIWDTFSRGRVSFDVAEMHDDKFEELGYIAENNVMLASIFKRLKQLSSDPSCGLEIAIPSKISYMNYEDAAFTKSNGNLGTKQRLSNMALSNWVEIRLEDGTKITTRLVVGADGALSSVKRAFGLGAVGWDYNQRGVVATVQHESPNHTAYQRFLPSGPVAFLPCHGNYSSIVWSTSNKHSKHLLNISDEQFLADLNSVYRAEPQAFTEHGDLPWFSDVLPSSFSSLLPILFPPGGAEKLPPKAESVIERAAFPLQLVHTNQYVLPRVAVIGDAAHVVHPMAGQGVNLGFEDAAQLQQVLSKAVKTGLDVGDLSILEMYESAQKPHNVAFMGGVDAIKRVFSVSEGPFALARNVGMDFLNSFPAAKDRLAKFAMGVN